MTYKTSTDRLAKEISVEDSGKPLIEEILSSDGNLIAYVLRHDYRPSETVFITSSNVNQQVGFIVYPKGGIIARHSHKPIQRKITGTQEVLLVRSGQAEVDLYTDRHEFVARRTLEEGDVLILVSGGHGFRMLKDTVLMEIKQGPYLGTHEKEHF
jgi:uncharacterized protein with PhoU and TrkA domain